MKLLVREAETDALADWVIQGAHAVSTTLSEKEVRRSAQRLGVDRFVTYDARQSAAATEFELTVASPR